MGKRWREWGAGALCLCILTAGMLWQLLTPDTLISVPERRRLAQAPALTADSVGSGTFMSDLERYLQDQFPMRQQFRQVKAQMWYHVLQMKDNQGIYIQDGYAGKLDYPLNEASAERFAGKLESLRKRFFPQSQCRLAVIPDKNYYLAEPNGYPDLDYGRMRELLEQELPEIEIYDLSVHLKAADYYRTDIHWRQEQITDAAEALLKRMGVKEIPDWSSYERCRIPDFYGSYYGQAALPMEAEELVYLTSEATQAASVWHLETGEETPVYDLDKLNDPKSVDMYDIFLSGADALQVITNPAAKGNRELIVFRDSFASSFVPLLLEAYERITLIDLRYLSSELLDRYVDFGDQSGADAPDVLFLYHTRLINQSAMLR